MKNSLHLFVFVLNIFFAYPQIYNSGAFTHEDFVDSVLNQLKISSNDVSKVDCLNSLGEYYLFIRQDSAVYYLEKAIELSEKINYPDGSYAGYVRMAHALNYSSNYAEALNNALKSLKIAEQLKHRKPESMAISYGMMALINFRNHFDTLSLQEDRESIVLFEQANLSKEKAYWSPYGQISLIYTQQNHLDSALLYAKKAYDISLNAPARGQSQVSVTSTFVANVYARMGNNNLARYYFLRGIEADKKFNAPLLRVRIFNNFARFYKNIGKLDSCIYYAEIAYQSCQNHQFGEHAVDAAGLVAQSYEQLGKSDSALKYMKIFVAAKDTIFNQSKLLRIQVLNFDEGQRQKDIQREIQEAKERYLNKIRFYSLLATVGIFMLIIFILYRNNLQKLMANRTLESQKKEIDHQRVKAESALYELRSAQAQLVQSEKMASLGELTAGIAHEIQNPLNFMNNFSEVNIELIEEMRLEMKKGNIRDADSTAQNIIENELKINHHGKRADAIVKGMLQHSQKSSGQKELVNINGTAEECLRLCYHSFRSKDKSFQVNIKTDFDKGIGKISIIPQDIGRVLLNLFNNAFYAVNEKSKQQVQGYEPIVTVTAKKINDKIILTVMDNGVGIPQKAVDKIFQPFFTTKPTGQGTGLGLSLSYDIVKAHGGEIKVETKEGEFTMFILQFPS
ncbi:MAG TPA: ATP-binding protein [Puia sp.]|nr:ATP-binding protein [Puia sp.]